MAREKKITFYSSEKKGRRRYDPLAAILGDWYGKAAASYEMIPHLSSEKTIGSLIDTLVKDGFTGDDFTLMEIKKKWEELMGSQIAKVSRPCNRKNGILYVEVTHSAWLMELRNNSRVMMLDKIKRSFGNDFCRDIRFIIAGRNI